MDGKIKLYIDTVKYLKPSQIYHRPVNRIKRKLYASNFIQFNVPSNLKINYYTNFLIPELDFDIYYLKRFDTKDIFDDRFTFINITNQSELSEAWNNKGLQHLWRYNLHYFEYLFKLAYEYSNGGSKSKYYDKFKYLVENWIDNNKFSYGDGWHPYTISLRLTNWISVYQIFIDRIKTDIDFDRKIIDSIYLQYKYLQKNLEKDVLGNHYFENIKALIIGSIFFEDKKLKETYKDELLKQLDEQILKDGMHFELSPMYHKIILEDLIKITYWLKNDVIYSKLVTCIQKMIDVSYSLEDGFGKTPAFNDSADGISKENRCLVDTCAKYFDLKPEFKDSLEDSGFYIIKDQYKKLIFDTGEICPSYLPAHGHCDALSFELSIDSEPLIVNSGTYRYENGEWRNYFRSTKAHNTVVISEQEQSQFWGSFRVANRINNVRRIKFDYKDIQFYAGAYVSSYGNEHKRFIGCLDENTLIVLDSVHSKLNAKSYLHFVPGTQLSVKDNTVNVVLGQKQIKLIAIGVSNIGIEDSFYSEQFNFKEENHVLVMNKNTNKGYFGFLIDLNPSNYKVSESGNKLNIIGNKELIINYDRLGDLL